MTQEFNDAVDVLLKWDRGELPLHTTKNWTLLISSLEVIAAAFRNGRRLGDAIVALPRAEEFEALVANTMEDCWEEIAADTKCHPLDIVHCGGKQLTFQPRHWTTFVAALLRARLIDRARAETDAPRVSA